MSLRKRLSFKRVWNFNTVGNAHAHQIQPKRGLFFFCTPETKARDSTQPGSVQICWSESTLTYSKGCRGEKGIHYCQTRPDNGMGRMRQMGMNEDKRGTEAAQNKLSRLML